MAHRPNRYPLVPACKALLAAALCACGPGAALAACATPPRIVALYSAYSDLIEGAGTPREKIGRYVLKTQFGSELGGALADATLQSARPGAAQEIETIAAAARALAETGISDPSVDIAHHLNLRQRLQDGYIDAECLHEATRTEPRDTAANRDISGRKPPPNPLEEFFKVRGLAIIAACLSALTAVAALYRIWRGRHGAVELDRRFPRLPIDADVEIRPSRGNPITCRMSDISRGGFKTNRPAGFDLTIGASATASLAGFEIATKVSWRNEHFIGFRLEEALSSDQLTGILAATSHRDVLQNETAPPMEAPQEISA